MGNGGSNFGLPPRGKYGLKHEHRDLNDEKIKLSKKRSRLDNFSMKKSFPPIDNQGEYATSVAHAIAAILEFEQVRLNREPIKISKLYLHALGNGKIRKTLQRIRKNGLVADKDLPYNSHPPFPIVDEVFYVNCLKFYVIPSNIYVINSALYEGYPILIGLNIYDSFLRRELWDNDGVMPIPEEGENYEGSMGAVITGYSAIKRAYEVRLSWGIHFKNDGYFYMPEKIIENKYFICSIWAMRLEIPNVLKPKHINTKTQEELNEEPQIKEVVPKEPAIRKKFSLG